MKKHIENAEYDFILFSKFKNNKNSNFVKKLNWSKYMDKNDQTISLELSEFAIKKYIFEKSTYSIFKADNFLDFLREHKISKLYFCGLDLDACILASVYEAFDLGFDFEILFDLSSSSSKIDLIDSSKKIIKRNLNGGEK